MNEHLFTSRTCHVNGFLSNFAAERLGQGRRADLDHPVAGQLRERGHDLGIDQLLFHEEPGAAGTYRPNRMGPPASTCFPLLGIALFLIERRTRKGRAPSQTLALVAILMALIPILGYVFGVEQLYGIARYTGIALHTAVAFVLLATGILLARADASPMRQFAAADSGGILLRRMLPGAILCRSRSPGCACSVKSWAGTTPRSAAPSWS